MRYSQFSLRWLLGATALVALGCTALLNATTLWESLFVSFTLATLVTAVVLAAYTRATPRAFWVGFCIFGWGYFLVAYVTRLELHSPGRYGDKFTLVTTQLLDLGYDYGIPLVRTPVRPTSLPLPPELPSPPGAAYPSRPSEPVYIGERFLGLMTHYPTLSCFLHIGHCLWTIFFANVGGRFARYLYDRNNAADSTEGRT